MFFIIFYGLVSCVIHDRLLLTSAVRCRDVLADYYIAIMFRFFILITTFSKKLCGRGFAPLMSFAGREQPTEWGPWLFLHLRLIGGGSYRRIYAPSTIIFPGSPAHPRHAPISTPTNSVYYCGHLTALPPIRCLFRHRTFCLPHHIPQGWAVSTVVLAGVMALPLSSDGVARLSGGVDCSG